MPYGRASEEALNDRADAEALLFPMIDMDADRCPCGGHMIEVGEGADERLVCDECGEGCE